MSAPFLAGLARLSPARSRSISAENPDGAPGAGARADCDPAGPARALGRGWKCRPNIVIAPGATALLADIEGPGTILHCWFAGLVGRELILRIHWDDGAHPAVETPLTDFFALPWVDATMRETAGPAVEVDSLMVAVLPNRGLNCYWPMPFRRRCRITLENRHATEARPLWYQIDYELGPVPEDAANLHAVFRRSAPLAEAQRHVLLDVADGPGHYVGTALGCAVADDGWWGEGEMQFHLDDDGEHPTICGTGTEDYFGGAWNWEVAGTYRTAGSAFLGMHWFLPPDGLYRARPRHAMYRWHVADPIRWQRGARVSLQAIGWRGHGPTRRFAWTRPELCSVALWYQAAPAGTRPPLPPHADLEL